MKTSINAIKSVMLNAHKAGYQPVLTINGEYIDIDYKDKKPCEADQHKCED